MLGIDYEAVRVGIRDAARRAFTLARESHAKERFYTFALCSDLDATSLCASSNTEEGYQRQLKRNEKCRQEVEESIAKHGLTWADYTNYFRWNLPEWAYHSLGTGEFRALDPLIADPLEQHADEFDDDDPAALDDHRAGLYGAMVRAMADLDAERFFGEGAARTSVVLLCDIVEPPEKYWFAVETARRLNPPEVFDGFLKQWLAWLSPEDRAAIEDPAAHSTVFRPLVSVLDGES